MNFRKLIPYIFFALFIYACSSEEKTELDTNQEPPALEKVSKSPEETFKMLSELKVEISAFPPRFPDGINPQEYMQESGLHMKSFDVYKVLRENKDSDWQDVRKAIAPYINEYEGTEYEFFFRQVEALAMIDMITKKGTLSDEEKENLSKYTQTLLDYKYNRVFPIAEGLKRLKGYWDKDQIKTAARATLNEHNVFNNMMIQARQKAIAEGKIPENSRIAGGSQPDFLAQINKAGVSDLERLSQ